MEEDLDYLSKVPVEIFIKQITYLPFRDVVNICQANEKLHNYCTDTKYKTNWKPLILNTFGQVSNYEEKLGQVWSDLNLGEDTYNYLVYTNMVKTLDPITQLMIYYRQGDMESFDGKEFNNTQRFLSLFLLGKKDKMEKYLPKPSYRSFIDVLNNQPIVDNSLQMMINVFSKYGNIKGINYFMSRGADINIALIIAGLFGHLDAVRYLVEQGADIHFNGDAPMRQAALYGQLEIIKYLAEQGVNIHIDNDRVLRNASQNGHLDVVRYLLEQGADVHFGQGEMALGSAVSHGHFDTAIFLLEHGANIHSGNDWALIESSRLGNLEGVKFLLEHGANIHARNDGALLIASANKKWDVVKFLVKHGADIHVYNDATLHRAINDGRLDVVKLLQNMM